jgi:hypothetical protein
VQVASDAPWSSTPAPSGNLLCDEERLMAPDDWFDLLRGRFERAVDAPTEAEISALLDLARVAAHTSERWTAPVSGFLAGLALAGLDGQARAARLRTLADDLEADEDTSS